VKPLIASKIKVCVYIIYVCVVCVYTYICMYIFKKNVLIYQIFTFMYNINFVYIYTCKYFLNIYMHVCVYIYKTMIHTTHTYIM